MPFVTLDGLSLHYRRAGAGEPLLLLAGMASDGASWQTVMPTLAGSFDVIAPDNRCAGRTSPAPIETSREAMVEDVLALVDALGIERFRILGHSMGAMLGWAIAARAPGRVTALVAASGLPEVLPARIDLFRTLARLRHTSDEADWFRLLFHFLFSPDFFADEIYVEAAIVAALAYPHRQGPAALTMQSDGLSSFLESPDLSKVACPVLAITGELDLLMSPASVAARHADDPRVRLASVAGAGHSLHWERPEAFLGAVLPFLKESEV